MALHFPIFNLTSSHPLGQARAIDLGQAIAIRLAHSRDITQYVEGI